MVLNTPCRLESPREHWKNASAQASSLEIGFNWFRVKLEQRGKHNKSQVIPIESQGDIPLPTDQSSLFSLSSFSQFSETQLNSCLLCEVFPALSAWFELLNFVICNTQALPDQYTKLLKRADTVPFIAYILETWLSDLALIIQTVNQKYNCY